MFEKARARSLDNAKSQYELDVEIGMEKAENTLSEYQCASKILDLAARAIKRDEADYTHRAKKRKAGLEEEEKKAIDAQIKEAVDDIDKSYGLIMGILALICEYEAKYDLPTKE